jgi:hypothetical protein
MAFVRDGVGRKIARLSSKCTHVHLWCIIAFSGEINSLRPSMNPVGVFRHTAADAMALIRSMQARAMDNGKIDPAASSPSYTRSPPA